jgi:hypothetical protein
MRPDTVRTESYEVFLVGRGFKGRPSGEEPEG